MARAGVPFGPSEHDAVLTDEYLGDPRLHECCVEDEAHERRHHAAHSRELGRIELLDEPVVQACSCLLWCIHAFSPLCQSSGTRKGTEKTKAAHDQGGDILAGDFRCVLLCSPHRACLAQPPYVSNAGWRPFRALLMLTSYSTGIHCSLQVNSCRHTGQSIGKRGRYTLPAK